MRILSTGDWHYNAGYDQDVDDSVIQIIEYADKDRPDLIVITGDVYERASDPGSRNVAAERIQALSNIAKVLVVRGNHDAPGDLKILERIVSKNGVEVFEQPYIYQAGANTLIHVLPWLTKARWQACHPSAEKAEGDRTVSQLSLEYLKNNIALYPGYIHIVAAHMSIAGARAQNHQQMGADGICWGMDDMIDAGVFAAMLGHIHLKQDLGSNLHFYNGSIAALDYGEIPDKYFSVLDTLTQEVEWIHLNTTHRQDVVASWTPIGVEIKEMPVQSHIEGARIRVNLHIEAGDNIDLAKQSVTSVFMDRGALEVKINPQVVPVSKVRAVDIAKAVKLSDKLKQYWAANETPDEETQKDMLDKLAQLEDECSL